MARHRPQLLLFEDHGQARRRPVPRGLLIQEKGLEFPVALDKPNGGAAHHVRGLRAAGHGGDPVFAAKAACAAFVWRGRRSPVGAEIMALAWRPATPRAVLSIAVERRLAVTLTGPATSIITTRAAVAAGTDTITGMIMTLTTGTTTRITPTTADAAAARTRMIMGTTCPRSHAAPAANGQGAARRSRPQRRRNPAVGAVIRTAGAPIDATARQTRPRHPADAHR